MGRLMAAQQFCSTLWDFKQSVAWILRRTVERGFTRKMVEKVWSKFLYTKWQTKDIHTQELRKWFPCAWHWVTTSQLNNVQNKKEPWKHSRSCGLDTSPSRISDGRDGFGVMGLSPMCSCRCHSFSVDLCASFASNLAGGELEIQAFAELYQIEVHMFQVHDSRNFRKTFVMRGSSPSVCRLLFSGPF